MECFVCGKQCGYPVCAECTREGYDINKIISGEQKPKKKKGLDEWL
jgi:hypothetical protein